MAMKLYQPVLFVGLGGTGCDVGAEFERRLRDEICGPDGNDFRSRRHAAGMLPYQLPSCVQFVYADMNQAELQRLPRRVAPGPEHEPAVAMTAHYASSLVPRVASYPDLARNLRLQAKRVTEPWLPPQQGEPKVNPLHKGAGQFPTIGRAALFGTFLDDKDTARAAQDIHTAIGKLAGSGADLQALGGQLPRGVDVFVAFSVAGGTGCGIFYDYLHLIVEAMPAELRVKIFPLVLMPSAFKPGLGGGRPAELNAGRALLDLFRLVDEQNAGDAQSDLISLIEPGPIDPDEVAVHYPRNQKIVLPAGIIQTGFLFSQPDGATRPDMHRSIVSLMLSLVGTELTEEDHRNGDHHQSFADSFVNEAVHRQVPAENAIGNRGVSTALVASLTVPVDDLAGIVGARLLRTAVEQMAEPAGRAESNLDQMEEFLNLSNVHPVFARAQSDYGEPTGVVHGAREVTAALNDRREAMRGGIANLRAQLARDVSQYALKFEPSRGVNEMLGTMDVFRVQRIVYGHPRLGTDIEQGGAHGVLVRRRGAPPNPNGFGAAPPPVPELKDRFMRKVQWHDEAPVAAREEQDQWYEWATHGAWAEAWELQTSTWRPPLDRVRAELSALTRKLLDFALTDHEDFDRRSEDLYRKRVGVSYLLPSGTGRLDQFYQLVVRRMLEKGSRDGGQLHPNSREADLAQTLIGADGWRDAYKLSVDYGPDRAVALLRELLKTRVKSFLREADPGEQPLLPELKHVLAQAAGHVAAGSGMDDYLEEFKGKLAGMVPANFIPQGSGPLKVLVSYPADAPSDAITRYLKNSVLLPEGPGITDEYRNSHTESISVVLFRTAMGVTEVGEVRKVLRLWAGALIRPERTDLLSWRQRTGYDFGYLATREDHRVEILHRLLCALWNGLAEIELPADSPARLTVKLGGVRQTLPLARLGQASSWGSLLRSYELWALDDDDIHRRFCEQLMSELPVNLNTMPDPPHHLYTAVRNLAEGQTELLDSMLKKEDEGGRRSRAAQMKAFWERTLPAALDKRFQDVQAPVAPTLRRLELEVGLSSPGHTDGSAALFQADADAAAGEPTGSGA